MQGINLTEHTSSETHFDIEATRHLFFHITFDPDIDAVKNCLKRNINLNDQTIHESHYTPLMEAISRAQYPIVKLLLAQGADIHKVSDNQYTALHIAAHYCDGQNRYSNSAQEGIVTFTKIIAALLKKGANPNAFIAGSHDTPLILAARRGNREAVYMLLKYGANPHLINSMRETALFTAMSANHLSVVDCLLLYSGLGLKFSNLPSNVKDLLSLEKQSLATLMIPYKRAEGREYITTLDELKEVMQWDTMQANHHTANPIDYPSLLFRSKILLTLLEKSAVRDVVPEGSDREILNSILRQGREQIATHIAGYEPLSLKWLTSKKLATLPLNSHQQALLKSLDLEQGVAVAKDFAR